MPSTTALVGDKGLKAVTSSLVNRAPNQTALFLKSAVPPSPRDDSSFASMLGNQGCDLTRLAFLTSRCNVPLTLRLQSVMLLHGERSAFQNNRCRHDHGVG